MNIGKLTYLCGTLLPVPAFVALAGCSHSTAPATIEQQKADVMGGPAPASAQAQVNALRAAQAQRQAQGQQQDQQKAQAAAAAQRK